MSESSPSGRPVQTVLDALRVKIELDRFDAAVFELDTIAADLGYGDVRPLSASVAWIDHLREAGKRIALVDGGVRGESALALAGLSDRFELCAATLADALSELDLAAGRTVAVAASGEGITSARAAASISRSPSPAAWPRPSGCGAPARTLSSPSSTSSSRARPAGAR